jgi:DNA-binding MarR family transcriptional regulator
MKKAEPESSFQLCRLIGRIRAEFLYGVEREMERRGVELNFAQFLALKLLGDDKSMAPGELARLMHYNAGALTRMLDKLEQGGYLRRVPDPQDRRALRLELTAAGKAIRRRAIGCSESTSEKMFADVGSREKEQLNATLTRVLERLQRSG